MQNLKNIHPASKPKSPADKLNSDVNNGESVAVIALKSADIKYPHAKTENIITAFLIGKIFFSIYLN